MSFAHVDKCWTVAEFDAFVRNYNFGPVLPDFMVLHHTYSPGATWAPAAGVWNWDDGERGMTEQQIKDKRIKQVRSLASYYTQSLGWKSGPHLIVDDRYIYGMTPMAEVGIHATFGNSFRRNGRLHYSIGWEMVGNFSKVRWPAAMQAVVRGGMQALQRRLGTFNLEYMYADGLKPGAYFNTAAGYWEAQHPDLLRWGGLSSHRDYNKPACPGDAITEEFYTSVIQAPQDTP